MASDKRNDFAIELGEVDRDGSSSSTPLHFEAAPKPIVPKMSAPAVVNNPLFSILAYCGSSILMTVSNKYCVNGTGWNLSFFLLAVQVWNTLHFAI